MFLRLLNRCALGTLLDTSARLPQHDFLSDKPVHKPRMLRVSHTIGRLIRDVIANSMYSSLLREQSCQSENIGQQVPPLRSSDPWLERNSSRIFNTNGDAYDSVDMCGRQSLIIFPTRPTMALRTTFWLSLVLA